MSTHDTHTTAPAPDVEGLELLEAPDARSLATRSPSVPITLEELASLRESGALDVLHARNAVVETARRLSIRLTHPEDWVLFKSPDGRITGYLQDAGCDRVRDVIGVEVYGISTPERVPMLDGAGFMYLVRGNGRSRLTLQTVEAMEGGRASSDDVCKGKTGAELELLVRKSARANLDGNITRELTGLKSIPLDELVVAWTGTTKRVEHCRKGRGFGTQDERHGASREGTPDVVPPTCPHCAPVDGKPVRLLYRPAKGDRKAFYGCPNFEKHSDRRVIVNAEEWVAKSRATSAASSAKPAGEREPGGDD